MMEGRLAARLPMQLFVIDTKTGEAKTILRGTDWLNRVQFSPVEARLAPSPPGGPI